jgi:hypothetical protein
MCSQCPTVVSPCQHCQATSGRWLLSGGTERGDDRARPSFEEGQSQVDDPAEITECPSPHLHTRQHQAGRGATPSSVRKMNLARDPLISAHLLLGMRFAVDLLQVGSGHVSVDLVVERSA